MSDIKIYRDAERMGNILKNLRTGEETFIPDGPRTTYPTVKGYTTDTYTQEMYQHAAEYNKEAKLLKRIKALEDRMKKQEEEFAGIVKALVDKLKEHA